MFISNLCVFLSIILKSLKNSPELERNIQGGQTQLFLRAAAVAGAAAIVAAATAKLAAAAPRLQFTKEAEKIYSEHWDEYE